jgi:hypothetical protein
MSAGSEARLVAELARLNAAEIAAEAVGPRELEGLGLAPPRAALRVYGKPPEEGGTAPVLADVQLGVQKGDRILAKRADRDTIFRVDAALAEHVPVSLEAYRNRFVSKEEPDTGTPGAPDGAVLDPETLDGLPEAPPEP